MASGPAEADTRQRLLRTVKKEVKQIMEEAVTRKFVHEDSSHIISFCVIFRFQRDSVEKYGEEIKNDFYTPMKELWWCSGSALGC